MTTTLTFKKRVSKARRAAICSAVNRKFRPKLTPTGLILTHEKNSLGPVQLFLILGHDFDTIV